MWRGTSNARSTPATRWPWWSRRWPARPTSWSAGCSDAKVAGAGLFHDAREYDAIVASGEQVTSRPAGDRAAVDGHRRALLAGLADPDPDRQRPWRGAHRRHRRIRADRALRDGPGRRGRRLPGHRPGQPDRDARPRRLGHQRGGDRGRASRPTAATSTPMSTASTRPIRASSRRRGGWRRSPSRKCWKWRRSAPRCCRSARSSLPWCTRCAPSCAPVSTIRTRPGWATSTIRPAR